MIIESIKTIDDYVLPEQFGAVANGVTDDSKAIQAAIDTNKQVVLQGTYRINNPIYIKKNNQILTINGTLIVGGEAGIELTGSWNTIDGGGEIRVIPASDNSARAAIRILVTNGQNRGNIISVRRIYGGNRSNYNIGIEITGNGIEGGCCYDRITSDIEFFRYGVWCYKSEGQHPKSWYTNLYIDSSITGCIQAVAFDETDYFGCSGSFIKGAVQPLYTSEVKGTNSLHNISEVAKLPLVKVHSNCTIESFIWDLGSAVNDYAIEVAGHYNIISSDVDEKYLNIPYAFKERTYVLRGITKNGCKILSHRDAETNALNSFSNENDILLDCFNNDDVIVKHSTDLKNYYAIKTPSAWERILFDGTNLNTSPSLTNFGFEFEFAEAKAIRGFILYGTKLPDTISLKVRFTGDTEFTDIAELKADVDYPEAAYPYQAVWTYQYADYEKFKGFNKRNIESLRVNFINNTAKTINVARMAAFDVEPVNLIRKADKKYVDDLIKSIEERLTAKGL